MTGIVAARPIRSSSMAGSLSDVEIKTALEHAKATQRLEGIELSAGQEALVLRRLRGEITHDEFVRLAVELATRRDPPDA